MYKRVVVFIGFCSILLASCAFATVSGKKEVTGKPRWGYIIIHHSATKKGCATLFDKYHRRRGMKNGLAYHFVIDNGTCGKGDGQLEIGPRWKKQLPGGHCRQKWVNEQGIGICLVGNFNRTRPTSKQMRTLVNLVQELRYRYNIPIKNVLGHGQVKGEKTQCPGKYFPWKDFYAQLRELDRHRNHRKK